MHSSCDLVSSNRIVLRCAPDPSDPNTALAAACPLGLLLSHDLAPSPQEAAYRPKSAAEQAAAAAPVAAWRRCGGSAVEAAWRGVLLVVLAVLPLVLPRFPGGASPCSGGSCILFRVLVLVLCVVCAGSSILQRPYLLFLVGFTFAVCFPPSLPSIGLPFSVCIKVYDYLCC